MTDNRFSKLLEDKKGASNCNQRSAYNYDDEDSDEYDDGQGKSYLEGGGSLNDTFQSGDDDKETEFTKYVHDAKSELQNQVIKMYLLSVIFSVLMYFLFYYLISKKYDDKIANNQP